MAQKYTISIVIASPSDVAHERARLRDIIDDLNHANFRDNDIRLEPRCWEIDTGPGVHPSGPQGLIDETLQVSECDIFICIFWKKFGTPVKDAQSGTEHEFLLACNAWKARSKPYIMLYFKTEPFYPKTEEELAQYTKVLRFRNSLPQEISWWEFKTESEFERVVQKHLILHINKKYITTQPKKYESVEPPNKTLSIETVLKPAMSYAPASHLHNPEEQELMRTIALRKFAYAWLIMDHLPGGGWGRSLTQWMAENWRGSTITGNILMEDEGGLESSILGFHIYYHSYIVHAGSALTSEIIERFKQYMIRQQDPVSGGFGTRALKQEGIILDVRLRHTALGVYGLLMLNQLERTLYSQKITKTLHYLFGQQSEYYDDRNGCLLYIIMDFLSHSLIDETKDIFDAYQIPQELIDKILSWRSKHEPIMRSLFLTGDYKPIPTTIETASSFPFLVPYGNFYRMTNYTFLTVCNFVTDKSHTEIRKRIRLGLESLIKTYLANYGQIAQRFAADKLKPRLRGIPPWQKAANLPSPDGPDLGCTSLLFSVLCNEQVKSAIWDGGSLPQEFRNTPNLLLEDLAQLFDRYLINPRLYLHTHAVGFAHLLLVPITSCSLSHEKWLEFDKVVSKLRFEEGLSEFSINQFVEDEIFRKTADLPTHIFARSASRLLLDNVRPGRYPEGKFRFNLPEIHKQIMKVVDETLKVYQNPAFVQKFAGVWGSAPMTDIASIFMKMINERDGRTVLDVGSGPGQNAKLFVDAGFDVTLLDASKPMLEVATKALDRSITDPRCLLMDIRDLSSLTPGSFDGIWCSGTMAHFPDPLAGEIIAKLANLLSHKGVMMIDCAIDNSRLVSQDKRFFAYWATRRGFAKLLEAAGMEIKYVVSSYVSRNTYNESRLQIQWDDFLCIPRIHTKDMASTSLNLTTIAYDLIVRRFIDQHLPNINMALVEKSCSYMRKRCSGKRVLDAGCGPGHYTGAFAKQGFEAIGVDVSTLMVEMGSENYPECTFRVADFTNLSYPNSYFACVFCMAAFQHIPLSEDIALKTLIGFRRVLETNGLLMLDVQLYRETGFEPDGRFTQSYRDKNEVVELLDSAGFEVLEYHDFKLDPGDNSFRRQVELNFCDFMARKKSDDEPAND